MWKESTKIENHETGTMDTYLLAWYGLLQMTFT